MHKDNNPLTYILTSPKVNATSHHWVASLTNYNSTLNYKSGKANVDVLSHIPWEEHDWHIEDDTDLALISNVKQGTTLTGIFQH